MKLRRSKIEFKDGWDKHYSKYNIDTKERIIKKIEQMKQPLPGRGLKKSKFLVEEVGQYRIAYFQNENVKEIHFVGNHKQYEKWYKKIWYLWEKLAPFAIHYLKVKKRNSYWERWRDIKRILDEEPIHQTAHFNPEQHELIHNNNFDLEEFLEKKQGNNKRAKIKLSNG